MKSEKRRGRDDQDLDQSPKRFQRQELSEDHLCRNQETHLEIQKRVNGQDLPSINTYQVGLNHLEERCMRRSLRSLRRIKNNEIILTTNSENLRLTLTSTPEDLIHTASRLRL